MRNLQKILALALALIMSFSLVVTANAAFSDEADITDTYNEAVNVLSQLEVFKGYTDGTYQPQKSISRAEVAAIIYRIATGDVTDAQVSIYSDWNRFSDVHAGEWWAGYINYCANAEYIKGYGNGKFGPDDPVTGYEALAMILRAVGYGKMEGEFQGSDWAVQTAARANTLKVTKNVQNSALLNSAATRELVAELLFRSILVPTVEYNQFSGYTENSTTLGYQSFGLEAIEGVVVANEYANLYDTDVLADGKTDLEVAKDDVRHLDIASEITDIGEAHYAYISGSTVYALENTGSNTVWEPENGKGTDISTDKKFKDKSGLEKTDDTEFYEDFGHEGHFSSDYRLEFKVRFADADAKTAFEKDYETGKIEDSMDVVTGKTLEFTQVIRAEEEISEEQLNIMKGIFSMADEEDADDWYVKGEVYAGTRSVDDKNNRYDDLSDTISYRTFYNDYINDQAWDQDIEKSENGEWLKIVDNDGDGKADYAFLTHYYLDEATGTYTKGGDTYTEYNTLNVERFEDDDGIVKYIDEIAVGDVVLYTIIDNKICIQKAEVLTDKVNSVSFRDETITTVGGETKGQSGIYNRTDMDEVIVEMDEDVEYNMYLDRYGYVRAYELAQGTKYALLTELYWTRGSNVQYVTNRDLRAEVKAADAKIDEFDVLNDKDNDFDMEEVLGGTYNNWGQLTTARFPNTLYADINDDVDRDIVLQPATAHLSLAEEDGDEFFTPALTNVARYVMTDDGVRISSAAEYAETTKNEQLYYANYKADGTKKTGNDLADINKDGRCNTGDKVTIDTWKAWYKENVNKDATAGQLETAWKAADLQKVYDIDYIELDNTKNIAEDARRYDIAGGDEQVRSLYVNAIHSTEYYIVNQTDKAIRYFVDYNGVPEIDAEHIQAAYAVAHNTSSNDLSEDYWVADVIVIEVADGWVTSYDSISLVFDNFQQTSSRTKYLDTLNNESSDPELSIIPTDESWGRRWSDEKLGFYTLNETKMEDDILMVDDIKDTPISSSFNSYGIYAGRVARVERLSGEGDYLMVYVPTGNGTADGYGGNNGAGEKQISIDRAEVYGIDGDEAEKIYLANIEDNSDVKTGDRIIWVENDDGDVAYIVDVSDDKYSRDYATPSWIDDDTIGLWRKIWNEENAGVRTDAPTVTFYGMSAKLTGSKFTAEVGYTRAKTANSAIDIVVTNGRIVTRDWNTGDDLTPSNTTNQVYTGGILGTDGNYYSFEFTQTANDGELGDLYAKDNDFGVAVVYPDSGNPKLYVGDGRITLNTLKSFLASTKGKDIDVTVVGTDPAGDTSNIDTVAEASIIKVTLKNTNGGEKQYTFSKSDPSDPGDTLVLSSTITGYYKITLGAGVKAYTDSAFTKEIASGSYVKAASNVYVAGEGYGTLKYNNTNFADSTYNKTTGRTESYIAVGADTEFTFTKLNPVNGKITGVELRPEKRADGAILTGTVADRNLVVTVPDAALLDLANFNDNDGPVAQNWFTTVPDELNMVQGTGEISGYATTPDDGYAAAIMLLAEGLYGGSDDEVKVNFKVDTNTPKAYAVYFTVAKESTNNFNIALKDLSTDAFLSQAEMKVLGVENMDIKITRTPVVVSGGAITSRGTSVTGTPTTVKYIADDILTGGDSSGTIQASGMKLANDAPLFLTGDQAVYNEVAGIYLGSDAIGGITDPSEDTNVLIEVSIGNLNIVALHGIANVAAG